MASITNNPILDFFKEENKSINTIEEFTNLVRKIEAAKNYNSELFIKLLIHHRIYHKIHDGIYHKIHDGIHHKIHDGIIKGNGYKSLYYISMMVLREEDPDMYFKILNLLKGYPKDILRLCRIYNFIGQHNTESKIKINIKETNGHKNVKFRMWDRKNGNNTTYFDINDNSETSSANAQIYKKVNISVETKLYGDLIYKTIN